MKKNYFFIFLILPTLFFNCSLVGDLFISTILDSSNTSTSTFEIKVTRNESKNIIKWNPTDLDEIYKYSYVDDEREVYKYIFNKETNQKVHITDTSGDPISEDLFKGTKQANNSIFLSYIIVRSGSPYSNYYKITEIKDENKTFYVDESGKREDYYRLIIIKEDEEYKENEEGKFYYKEYDDDKEKEKTIFINISYKHSIYKASIVGAVD